MDGVGGWHGCVVWVGRADGTLSLGGAPVPSLGNVIVLSASPPPATDVTVEVAMSILRMTELTSSSVTKAMRPSFETHTPDGLSNLALVPMLSSTALPAFPAMLPAKMVTAEVLMSMRLMLLLKLSATKAKSPDGEMLTPFGALNLAATPTPGVLPAVEPAIVVVELCAIAGAEPSRSSSTETQGARWQVSCGRSRRRACAHEART